MPGQGVKERGDLSDEPTVRWPDAPGPLDRYYRGLDQGPDSQPGRPGPAAASLLEALRLASSAAG